MDAQEGLEHGGEPESVEADRDRVRTVRARRAGWTVTALVAWGAPFSAWGLLSLLNGLAPGWAGVLPPGLVPLLPPVMLVVVVAACILPAIATAKALAARRPTFGSGAVRKELAGARPRKKAVRTGAIVVGILGGLGLLYASLFVGMSLGSPWVAALPVALAGVGAAGLVAFRQGLASVLRRALARKDLVALRSGLNRWGRWLPAGHRASLQVHRLRLEGDPEAFRCARQWFAEAFPGIVREREMFAVVLGELEQQGAWDDVLRLTGIWLKSDPEAALVHRHRARALEALGHLDEAESRFELADEIEDRVKVTGGLALDHTAGAS